MMSDFFLRLCLLSFLIFSPLSFSTTDKTSSPLFVPDVDNNTFRNAILGALKSKDPDSRLKALDALDAKWNNYYQKTDWHIRLSIFSHGKKIGEGKAFGKSLKMTLMEALHKAQNQSDIHQENTRYRIEIDYYPHHQYAFIEFEGHGLELTGNRVVTRIVTYSLLEKTLFNAKDYLQRVMDPQYYGFYKWYNAASDKKETDLRTVYSASALYTLISLQTHYPELSLTPLFSKIGDFILSQQIQSRPDKGGFYYAFSSEKHLKRGPIVSGTASKSIFSLLLLNKALNDSKYLKSAMFAGDWLLTMIEPDGKVISYVNFDKEKRVLCHRYSLLYSGQVLSALSRLYEVTKEARYYNGAQKIARHFLKRIEQEGTLLGDDYRPANSISSSWVLMSLIDFSRISKDWNHDKTLFRLATALKKRQIQETQDVFNHGRYLDAMTASGNGWLNEVMGHVHALCLEKNNPRCQEFERSIIASSRWLLQNAYRDENSWNIPNPLAAKGGFITNFASQTVRTDAVCHAMNSFLYLLKIEKNKADGPLLTLHERLLPEILPLLRAGDGRGHLSGSDGLGHAHGPGPV